MLRFFPDLRLSWVSCLLTIANASGRRAHFTQSAYRTFRLAFAGLALFLATLCFQTPATADTFNVSDAAGLRAALITAAINGQDDVIALAAGTYPTGGTTFAFVNNENRTLTLQGANGTTRDQVILDGGGTSQVLNFTCLGSSCAATTLRGLTVQNGIGGVTATSALIVFDSPFSNNTADGSGGGISGSTVTVTGSIFNGNSTTIGNGGAISGAGNITVINSTFNGNSAPAGNGGAIWGFGTVTNSTFSGNSAAHSGGAISDGGTVNNSTFINNTAGVSGGAIGGGGTVISSTFTHNTTGGSGGAIRGAGNVTVTNSTFSGNSATESGGAIDGSFEGPFIGRPATVTGSTFTNNSALTLRGGAISGGGTVTHSAFSGNWAPYGGALSGDGTVISSTFINNSAGGGGAIYGAGIIVNNTFSGNSAIGPGAAISLTSSSLLSPTSIINSVFYEHSTPAVYSGSPYNLYNNLINASTGIAGSAPLMAGNVTPGSISPFVNAANGNFRLAAGSLAIDAGLDMNSTTFANLVGSDPAPIRQALRTDLDGNPRPTPGTAVDMGAYEFVPPNVFTARSDCLLNWAGITFPGYFAPVSGISGTLATYYYRYYSQTNAYLAMSSADNHLYYLGPLSDYLVFDLGALTGWLTLAGCQ